MKKIKYIYLLLLFLWAVQGGFSQEKSWGDFDFKIKAGVNIGGTSPMGIPAQVREIKSFNPLISFSIGADVVRWLDARWGVSSGVRFENKGMTTVARVKEYAMRLRTESGEMSGLFTGEVETKVKNGYLNIPLALHYRALTPLSVHAGAYYACLLDPSFTGSAYGGHFRQGNPGSESNIGMAEPSYYGFSSELNRHDVGLLCGVEWDVLRHLAASFDLSWGLRSVFAKGFTGVSFAMYNVYSNFAFGYRF
ncbi:MAG: PorT family protein [Prevotellaceae bacterium]|jgi:hypothetical protein|nr:PorT family protein [Prevotellaceae bacterium]